MQRKNSKPRPKTTQETDTRFKDYKVYKADLIFLQPVSIYPYHWHFAIHILMVVQLLDIG